MKKSVISTLLAELDRLVQVEQESGVEFWLARDLQTVLGYTNWQNFRKVVGDAVTACEASGNKASDQFIEVSKLISHGKGGRRDIQDFIEKRISEVERLRARKKLTESEKLLSALIYEKVGDERSFGIIRSRGDQALFGGHTTQDMKTRLGVPDNRPLADFLPTITIKAKDFANEITTFSIGRDGLASERAISNEHVKNNTDVRNLLGQRRIYPESLPPAEDVRKVERRLKSEEKKLPRHKAPE